MQVRHLRLLGLQHRPIENAVSSFTSENESSDSLRERRRAGQSRHRGPNLVVGSGAVANVHSLFVLGSPPASNFKPILTWYARVARGAGASSHTAVCKAANSGPSSVSTSVAAPTSGVDAVASSVSTAGTVVRGLGTAAALRATWLRVALGFSPASSGGACVAARVCSTGATVLARITVAAHLARSHVSPSKPVSQLSKFAQFTPSWHYPLC